MDIFLVPSLLIIRCPSGACIVNGKVLGKVYLSVLAIDRFSYIYKKYQSTKILKKKDIVRDKTNPAAKALAVLLYGSGKASYDMIAKLFNVTRLLFHD